MYICVYGHVPGTVLWQLGNVLWQLRNVLWQQGNVLWQQELARSIGVRGGWRPSVDARRE